MTSLKLRSGHFHYIMMEEHTNYMSDILDISHSDRCLNIGSVSRVPCSFIREMRHLSVFAMNLPSQTGHEIL